MSPCIGRLFCARARKYSTRWVGEVRMNIFQYRPATQLAVVQPPPPSTTHCFCPACPSSQVSQYTIHYRLLMLMSRLPLSLLTSNALRSLMCSSWPEHRNTSHPTSSFFFFMRLSRFQFLCILWCCDDDQEMDFSVKIIEKKVYND